MEIVWTERKKTMHRLLRRAFEQNRGADVILRIQWLCARESHKNDGYARLAKIFNEENIGQPRALRALNLLVQMDGGKTIFKDAVQKQKPNVIRALRDTPPEQCIMVPQRPRTYLGTSDAFGIMPKSDDEISFLKSVAPFGQQRLPFLTDDTHDAGSGQIRNGRAPVLAAKPCDPKRH